MGYLNAGEEMQLYYNSTYDQDWLEYKFMTNYKKVYFNLITNPSTSDKFKQRIILSNIPYDKCPHKWMEGNNFCHAVSNKIYSENQVMYSKWFPTLFIYIINQPVSGSTFIQQEISQYESNYKDLLLEKSNSQIIAAGIDDDNDILEPAPVFTLTPVHLEQGCLMISSELMPRWASLGNDHWIDPAFCTRYWKLLNWLSNSGENLFSLCTASILTDEDLNTIWSAHILYEGSLVQTNWVNPIPYEPSLSKTTVSILLVILLLMGVTVIWVFAYNIRLLKTGEVPWEFWCLCPEWLFPSKWEDNPLYKGDLDNDSNYAF